MAAATQLSGVVTAATLNNAFGQFRTALDTRKAALAPLDVVHVYAETLNSNILIQSRSLRFTPTIDMRIKTLVLRVHTPAAVAAAVFTLTLRPFIPFGGNGNIKDTTLLDFTNGKVVSVSYTQPSTPETGPVHARTDYSMIDIERLVLRRGVPMDVVLSSTTATSSVNVSGCIVTESKWSRL